MPSCNNLSPAASDDHVSDTSNNPNDIINNIGLHVQYSIKKLLYSILNSDRSRLWLPKLHSAYEFKVMETVCEILKPFKFVTKEGDLVI